MGSLNESEGVLNVQPILQPNDTSLYSLPEISYSGKNPRTLADTV